MAFIRIIVSRSHKIFFLRVNYINYINNLNEGIPFLAKMNLSLYSHSVIPIRFEPVHYLDYKCNIQ